MGKIVVVGSTNTDLTVRVPRIPAPGETALGRDFRIRAGGKGANQAVAAARAGARVTDGLESRLSHRPRRHPVTVLGGRWKQDCQASSRRRRVASRLSTNLHAFRKIVDK